jgi:2-dehydropantoate 2-reductase
MICEGLAVAEAEGVRPTSFNGRAPDKIIKLMDKPDWFYRIIMDRIAKIDRKARSSMLDDLERGRSAELDYLQGEIVTRGKAAGVPTPMNAKVLSATRAAFAQGQSPRWSGADFAREFLSS